MNDYRWFNPTQPQTLQIAVLLSYISAIFAFLSGAFVSGFGLLIMVGLAGGAFGIANEKKWGYSLAVGIAGLQVLLYVVFAGTEVFQSFNLLISFVFDVALLLLLVHPMSRDYQRIWFR